MRRIGNEISRHDRLLRWKTSVERRELDCWGVREDRGSKGEDSDDKFCISHPPPNSDVGHTATFSHLWLLRCGKRLAAKSYFGLLSKR
jgi:hypothetical protein